MKPHRPPFRHNRNGERREVHESIPPDNEVEQDQEDAVKREAAYLRRLADDHTTIEIHLRTGETVKGFIEYYDRQFIRLTRKGAPNLFIYKRDIKYLSEVSAHESGKPPASNRPAM